MNEMKSWTANNCTELTFGNSESHARTERQFEGIQTKRAEPLKYEKYLNKEREINERTGRV